jgi:hypothetical protein
MENTNQREEAQAKNRAKRTVETGERLKAEAERRKQQREDSRGGGRDEEA